MRPVKVWDAPIRLFHWAIVILVFTSWLTAQFGWMDWHLWSGYAIFALLLFRFAWGFVGSDTARFVRFMRSPFAALRHLATWRRDEPDTEIGHNAAGGWMVLVLLGLLVAQVGTGLCANDQVMTEGPFAQLLGQETSDWLTHIHRLIFTAIEIAVLIHVLAVLSYGLFRRHKLIRPMVTGVKRLPVDVPAPRLRSPILAAVILAASISIVVFVVQWYGVT